MVVCYSCPRYVKPCYTSTDFLGYYTDEERFYSDNKCNYLVTYLPYKEFYLNPQTLNFYWDNRCSQLVVKGCTKFTTYSGYFTDGIEYYYDSQCSQKARVCRSSWISYDKYL